MDEVMVRIDKLMKEKHISQRQMCEFLGVSHGLYSQWKQGNHKGYRRYLPKIARFYGVSVAELIEGEKPFSEMLCENFSNADAKIQKAILTLLDMDDSILTNTNHEASLL